METAAVSNDKAPVLLPAMLVVVRTRQTEPPALDGAPIKLVTLDSDVQSVCSAAVQPSLEWMDENR